MKLIFLWLILSQTIFAAEFKKQEMTLGGKKLQVEVADNDERREQGLMFRKELPDNTGMIFIFDHEQPMSFWMKNTFVPLSIGFFSPKKRLMEVVDMEAMKSEMEQDPKIYRSRAPALYALEVPVGWFKKNRIKVGSEFKLGAEVKPESKTSK